MNIVAIVKEQSNLENTTAFRTDPPITQEVCDALIILIADRFPNLVTAEVTQGLFVIPIAPHEVDKKLIAILDSVLTEAEAEAKRFAQQNTDTWAFVIDNTGLVIE